VWSPYGAIRPRIVTATGQFVGRVVCWTFEQFRFLHDTAASLWRLPGRRDLAAFKLSCVVGALFAWLGEFGDLETGFVRISGDGHRAGLLTHIAVVLPGEYCRLTRSTSRHRRVIRCHQTTDSSVHSDSVTSSKSQLACSRIFLVFLCFSRDGRQHQFLPYCL